MSSQMKGIKIIIFFSKYLYLPTAAACVGKQTTISKTYSCNNIEKMVHIGP